MKFLTIPAALLVLTGLFLPAVSFAGGEPEFCPQLAEQVVGDQLKHAIAANVDGPIYFADIGCGIILRKDLCAMEMVAFDTSAKVYDFSSGAELEATKAFYVLGEKKTRPPEVIAFRDRNEAEKYAAEHSGRVMDFDTLVGNI